MPPIIAECRRDHGSAAISVPQTRDRAVCDPDTMPLAVARASGTYARVESCREPVREPGVVCDVCQRHRLDDPHACFILREGVADPWLRLA